MSAEKNFPAFDQSNQAEPWQNKVARELNHIVGRAEFIYGDPGRQRIDDAFVISALSIVKRVAEFEGIKTVEELKPKNRGGI